MTKRRRNPDAVETLYRTVVKTREPEAKYSFDTYGRYHVIQMPRKPLRLHGSAIVVKCNETCYAEGDIVIPKSKISLDETQRLIRDVEACVPAQVHSHADEFHIHFDCHHMNLTQVRKLIDVVKWF